MSVHATHPQGLSHLMEAATALAKLTGVAASQPTPNSGLAFQQQTSAGVLLQPSTLQQPVEVSNKSHQSLTSNINGGKPKIFPERLMDILNDKSLADTVTWLPHGRSFVIIRPDVFTEQVLPKYLPPVDARSSTKYPSFTRKLNRWGFRQATRGPDTGAFQHPLFRRDRPELCLQMVCQRTSSNAEKKKKQQQQQQQSSNNSRLPAKKRHVLLTKESLEAMTVEQEKKASQNIPSSTSTAEPHARAALPPATVSEDSLSNASDHQQNNPQATAVPVGRMITSDAALTQKALVIRNEEERMRVARAMLYDAYQRALRGEA